MILPGYTGTSSLESRVEKWLRLASACAVLVVVVKAPPSPALQVDPLAARASSEPRDKKGPFPMIHPPLCCPPFRNTHKKRLHVRPATVLPVTRTMTWTTIPQCSCKIHLSEARRSSIAKLSLPASLDRRPHVFRLPKLALPLCRVPLSREILRSLAAEVGATPGIQSPLTWPTRIAALEVRVWAARPSWMMSPPLASLLHPTPGRPVLIFSKLPMPVEGPSLPARLNRRLLPSHRCHR